MLQVLDALAIRRWADAALDQLDAHRDELDRTNVFPVPDGDTGTNLVLTMRAAVEQLVRRTVGAPTGTEHPDNAAQVAADLASGSLRGARGNSGVILSQMIRGLAEVLADMGQATLDGPAVASVLRRADTLARSAVSQPVEGTVLSVLRAAAAAATAAATPGEHGTGVLSEVVTAAARAAALALAETPRQLPVLARAGVVDAGGLGLTLLLDALVGVVIGRAPLVAVAEGGGLDSRDRAALLGIRETGSAHFDYEVMYLLDTTSARRVAALRARLDTLGDSVAVVGSVGSATQGEQARSGNEPAGAAATDAGLWHVHVHCTDVGAAVEAGIEAGRPHRITVVRFADQLDQPGRGDGAGDSRFRRARAVVTVVPGEPVAELVRAAGGTALVAEPEHPPGVGDIGAAIAGSRARHVVLLPNDVELTQAAEEAAEVARAVGQEVVVVPTSSVLQGLAALAVHDAQRRAGDDVVAMAEAAAATRTGVVQIAAGEALTWVGRCYAGDVLGLVDGEVVLIERDLTRGACLLADRMLTTGGELVTVLLGEDGPGWLGERLAEYLRQSHPEVDVVRYAGGPAGRPLQLGVE